MTDYASPTDEQFFGAIGRLAVSWGHIELGIDTIVALLHWRFGGTQTEAVMPWALKRKLTYIKNYFRRHYPTNPGTAAICDLMDEIAAASEARHDIIHGFIVEHAAGTGEAKLIRLLRDNEKILTAKHIHVTTTIILQHAVASGKLGSRILNISSGLIDDLQNTADESSGKV